LRGEREGRGGRWMTCTGVGVGSSGWWCVSGGGGGVFGMSKCGGWGGAHVVGWRNCWRGRGREGGGVMEVLSV